MSGNQALVVGEEGFPGTTLDCTRQTNLFFVDLTSNQVTGSVDVGTTPRRVVASPDGQRAFVSGFGEDCIFVVNTSTRAVERTFAVGDGPFGMAFTPDGADLLVVNRTEHRLQVLNPSTGEERLSIDTGGLNPEDVIVAPDGRTVIVINSGDRLTGAGGSINVFNLVP